MEINLKKAILRKIFEECSVIEIYFEKAIWKVLYNWNIFLDRYLKSVVQLKYIWERYRRVSNNGNEFEEIYLKK